MVQRHRMAAQRAQVMLQVVVQHRRRHSTAVGAVMEVGTAGSRGRGRGRTGGRVRGIRAVRRRGRGRTAVGGAGRRAGQHRTVAGGGTQGTRLRTGDHADIDFGLGGRHGYWPQVYLIVFGCFNFETKFKFEKYLGFSNVFFNLFFVQVLLFILPLICSLFFTCVLLKLLWFPSLYLRARKLGNGKTPSATVWREDTSAPFDQRFAFKFKCDC